MPIIPRRNNTPAPEPTVTGAILAPYGQILRDQRLSTSAQLALTRGRLAWDLVTDGSHTYAQAAAALGLTEQQVGNLVLDYTTHAGGAR